jgi:hypothetical protein
MPQGSENGASVLSEENVVDIRQRYLSGQWSYVELARRYRVTKTAIQLVLNCANWPHLLSEGEAEQLRQMRHERSNNRPKRRRTIQWSK